MVINFFKHLSGINSISRYSLFLKFLFSESPRHSYQTISKCLINRTGYQWNFLQSFLPLMAITGLIGSVDHKKFVRLVPTVSAATPTIGLKKGNREKFNFIADVVDVSAPAVVYIEIKDLRMKDYVTRQPLTASNGSGFIVESDGLILTNAHVVINKPHTQVHVKLHGNLIECKSI